MNETNTSLRAQSRTNWGRIMKDGIPTDEQLSAGSLMRIADALERPVDRDIVWRLVRVAQRFLNMRTRFGPMEKKIREEVAKQYRPFTYFSITIFGIEFSITKRP